ncbi:MAG: MATE family efflux transporter [Verrucomicrobiales bacterium]|nr:MATE family efflux transporter [Verrucomicrobiales bacterium]
MKVWQRRAGLIFASSLPCCGMYVLLSLRSVSDVYFLGQVGVDPQAAFATGFIMILMFLSFGLGCLFQVNSLVSKCVGKRWFLRCGSIVWQGIWFSLIYGIAVICCYFAAPFLFRLFGHDANLQVLEVEYFQIALPSAVFQLISWTVMHFFIAIGRPRVPLIIAGLALVVHVGCGYGLITGNGLGMGVAGAAWSLVFSSATMAVIAMACLLVPRSLRKYHTSNFRPRRKPFREIARGGAPIGGREFLEEFVWNVILIWIIGHFGNVHLAAAAVLISIQDVCILMFDSFGTSSVALISKAIGSGKVRRAENWMRVTWVIMNAIALICGLAFYLLRDWVIPLFSKSPEVVNLTLSLAFFVPIILLFYATYSTFDHALAATDDNSWPTIANLVISILMLVIGGAILVVYFFESHSYGAWTLITANLAVIAIIFLGRWENGAWKPT